MFCTEKALLNIVQKFETYSFSEYSDNISIVLHDSLQSSKEDAEARLKKEKRWRIYAALGEMPPKGRPSFNETTILKAKVLKKFGPKAKELFSLD